MICTAGTEIHFFGCGVLWDSKGGYNVVAYNNNQETTFSTFATTCLTGSHACPIVCILSRIRISGFESLILAGALERILFST